MIRLLKENIDTYYTAEYYSTQSGHGDLKFDKDFDTALKRAKSFLDKNKDGDLEYVGVIGNGSEFAILYITKKYIANRLNALDFNDRTAFKNFLKVAKKVLHTGKPLKGNFEN